MLPSNLPRLLRDAGLTVVEIEGWRRRGRPGKFDPVGVLNHHTGASAKNWTLRKELAYAKWMFLSGRSDLPAPLCQIALGRSGVVYVGAAGRANHAGKAQASGSVAAGDGNALYVGIEWMLSGTEKIPAKMMKAGRTLNAVLTAKATKTSVKTISAHYQTSITGKWDIGDPDGIPYKGKKVLDVDEFRKAVTVVRANLLGKPKSKNHLMFGRVWNLKVGRGLTKRGQAKVAREVGALLRDNPVWFGALETGGNVKAIGDALDGRYVRIGGGAGEKGSTRLYVRRGVKILDSGTVSTTTRWVGPKGGVHRGRTFPWATIRNNGETLTVMIVHKEWNRKRNKKAWAASDLAIAKFADGCKTPLLIPGDMNTPPAGMKGLANRINGRVVRTGEALDYAIARGILDVATNARDAGGSDHPAITYRVDKFGVRK